MDYTKRTGHNPPRGLSAGWRVLTTANAAGTIGLTCLPKHGARENKFLVTHPMTDQRCLTSTIVHWSALTAGPSRSTRHTLAKFWRFGTRFWSNNKERGLSTPIPELGTNNLSFQYVKGLENNEGIPSLFIQDCLDILRGTHLPNSASDCSDQKKG
jgi:hypothetical protein